MTHTYNLSTLRDCQEDHLSSGVGDHAELWWHLCTPAWTAKQNPVSKKKKERKNLVNNSIHCYYPCFAATIHPLTSKNLVVTGQSFP